MIKDEKLYNDYMFVCLFSVLFHFLEEDEDDVEGEEGVEDEEEDA